MSQRMAIARDTLDLTGARRVPQVCHHGCQATGSPPKQPAQRPRVSRPPLNKTVFLHARPAGARPAPREPTASFAIAARRSSRLARPTIVQDQYSGDFPAAQQTLASWRPGGAVRCESTRAPSGVFVACAAASAALPATPFFEPTPGGPRAPPGKFVLSLRAPGCLPQCSLRTCAASEHPCAPASSVAPDVHVHGVPARGPRVRARLACVPPAAPPGATASPGPATTCAGSMSRLSTLAAPVPPGGPPALATFSAAAPVRP
mmetsp:Transcript_81958/g.228433  ORF Transcript_81958/g.228433 Transcript_81958/m.228433 type:complete len:261 (+) Transcript_81958:472-1254(+)